jgi:3-oxoacyl-(acyl-carrier-protein) synthase
MAMASLSAPTTTTSSLDAHIVCTATSVLLPGAHGMTNDSQVLFDPAPATGVTKHPGGMLAGPWDAEYVTNQLRATWHVRGGVLKCLDTTNQAAVLVGLEAFGRVPSGSISAETTGVIFASSFPTLLAHAAAPEPPSHDRAWLFQQLVLANAQLAELLGARGPNVQISSACSSTTAAIALAQDWLRLGRCRSVLVVAADAVTAAPTRAAIHAAFAACGVTSAATEPAELASQPFGLARSGMVLGSGAVGLVFQRADAQGSPASGVRLLGTHISNSAYHGCRMDVDHLGLELERFLQAMQRQHPTDVDADRGRLARNLIYLAHETGTKGALGCASTEMAMLRQVFGEDAKAHLLVTGTKWKTGHAMGAAFEDVAAVLCLQRGEVPAVLTPSDQRDPALGAFCLPTEDQARHPRALVLHMAAGFGSQLAFALYATSKTAAAATGDASAAACRPPTDETTPGRAIAETACTAGLSQTPASTPPPADEPMAPSCGQCGEETSLP